MLKIIIVILLVAIVVSLAAGFVFFYASHIIIGGSFLRTEHRSTQPANAVEPLSGNLNCCP